MKKKLCILIFMLAVISPVKANIIPGNQSEWDSLEKSIVESVLWENYWKGRWEKGVYWKTNQVDIFTKKSKFTTMIVSIAPDTDEECFDVYVDELRSIISFSKKGNIYYLVGVSDQWFSDDVAKGYFENKAQHKKDSIKHVFRIKKQYFDVLKKQKLTSEKIQGIENLFDKSILTDDKMKYIKKETGKNEQDKFDIKISSFWNDYPCLYYVIKQVPNCYGEVIFDSFQNEFIDEHYFYFHGFADKKHAEYLLKKIDESGESFSISNGKLTH